MKSLLAAGLLLLLSALDARATFAVIESLEWNTDHASRIGVYKATEGSTLDLDESLKGDAPKTAPVQDGSAEAAGDRVIVFFDPSGKGQGSIDLSHPRNIEAITARLEVLTDADAIIRAVKDRVAHAPRGKHDARGNEDVVIGDKDLLVITGAIPGVANPKGGIGMEIPDDLVPVATARRDLLVLVAGLRAYYDENKTVPPGGNAEIVAALKKARVIPDIELNLNAAGLWCDPWGTPYRINLQTPNFPWAYSCGPNKTDEHGLPNSDDITTDALVMKNVPDSDKALGIPEFDYEFVLVKNGKENSIEKIGADSFSSTDAPVMLLDAIREKEKVYLVYRIYFGKLICVAADVGEQGAIHNVKESPLKDVAVGAYTATFMHEDNGVLAINAGGDLFELTADGAFVKKEPTPR
ncbi:MAG TPA: hypothetical protein VG733_00355 [Chthoniobacteraceae bacterium]|nr:hypothetical protein [Chthoniobacteraceae bacterium]